MIHKYLKFHNVRTTEKISKKQNTKKKTINKTKQNKKKCIKPTPQKKVVQDKQPKNNNCIEHTTNGQVHTKPTTPEQICIKPTTQEQETYNTHNTGTKLYKNKIKGIKPTILEQNSPRSTTQEQKCTIPIIHEHRRIKLATQERNAYNTIQEQNRVNPRHRNKVILKSRYMEARTS